MEAIILKGKDSNNEYDIPDDILQPREETKQQLQMIERALNITPVVASGSSTKTAPIPSKTSKTPITKPNIAKPSPRVTPARTVATIILDSDDEEEAPPKRTKMSTSPNKTKPTVNDKLMLGKRTEKTLAKPGPSVKAGPSSKPASPSVSNRTPGTSSRTALRNQMAEKSSEEKKVVLVANDLTKVERKIEDYIEVLYPKGEAIKKYEASAPYHFFLTAVTKCKETHKEGLSITMQEILDKSLGDLESSVQINFMVDVGWLLAHYYFAGHE